MGASSSIKRITTTDHRNDDQFISIGLSDAKGSTRSKTIDPSETKESFDSSLASIRVKDNTKFMDSTYIEGWLSKKEATHLYDYLKQIGDRQRPAAIAAASKQKSKYPLWTTYYGVARQLDGAKALDRWGSNYEGWNRVEDPPEILHQCCALLKKSFKLSDDAVNSMVVNYYYDGEHTYIPAHRDTVACLEDNSDIFCLSLGASREFVLCANEDAGKYVQKDMTVVEQYRVKHGDLFVLGPITNSAYCHAIPQEKSISNLRISIIFRTIAKSFIDFHAEKRVAEYADGRTKMFTSETITCKSMHDAGIREHLSDLINDREAKKRLRLLTRQQQQQPSTIIINSSTSRRKNDNNGDDEHYHHHHHHDKDCHDDDDLKKSMTITTRTAQLCVKDIFEKYLRNSRPMSGTRSISTPNTVVEDDESLDLYYMGSASTVPQTAL